ncbi:MAG: sigma-70 family RNA polymerase sigma factor [Clostridia bacterium]|nr:sigma-70 family RNA polymerase sigma factor [Clostridia bacterium]
MEPFERLFEAHRGAVERFVKFRLPPADADDVLQEVWLTAYLKRNDLQDADKAKAWLLSIARSRCVDYCRARAKRMEISLDGVAETALRYGRQGVTLRETVRDTLGRLGDVERQILYLYYFRKMPQAEIAAYLQIPPGTVKSRLNRARTQFREAYPYPPNKKKGENEMTKLPNRMPAYAITRAEGEPFSVRHEELAGMMIVPRCGEKLCFGMYDFPQKSLSGYYSLQVTGEAEIHGVRGMAIASAYFEKGRLVEERTIYAQLTEAFCRYLGGMHTDAKGGQKLVTFLDADFTDAYAIGWDNCGFPVVRVPRGEIIETEAGLYTAAEDDVSDVVGRYAVELGGRLYDTVRLIDLQRADSGAMLCEYYLDRDGRTILWRRFNHDNWALSRYGRPWSEQLPDNERLVVNGETYVHWYDCITDYIL